MTNPMLAELDEVVRLMEKATPGKWKGYRAQKYTHLKSEVGDYVMEARLRGQVRNPPDAAYIAALHNLFRTHHATLADMAKRLEAAERDAAKWRTREKSGAGHSHVCRRCGHGYTPKDGESEDCPMCGHDGIAATQEGEG